MRRMTREREEDRERELTITVSTTVDGRSEELWNNGVVVVGGVEISDLSGTTAIPAVDVRNDDDGYKRGSKLESLLYTGRCREIEKTKERRRTRR